MPLLPRCARLLALAASSICITFVFIGSAQMRTKTTTTSGKAAQQVQVERAQVLLVAGNDLVLKLDDGTIRHIANVPESFRATVDGKELGIFDLKAGMILQNTTTITTTPKLVRTVRTIKGKVWHVQPPLYVSLTMDDGTSERFEIPYGQKFKVEGQLVDAWGLKPGMIITAVKVVEFTSMEVEQERKMTGTMPSVSSPLPDEPILVAK